MNASKESFPLSILLLGLIVAATLTAANTYLGLYVGMTVSASIPAAVVSMGLLRALKKSNKYHSNLVQTMASAGESLAAGVLFTVPALVLVGAWKEFRFWPTTLIAMGGGVLGVLFMIPLRRMLILESPQLTYPEGVACAKVLSTGERSHPAKGSATGKSGDASAAVVAWGAFWGAAFKLAVTGLGLMAGTVEKAWWSGRSPVYLGTDISPALLGVGFIVRLPVAVLVFTGGLLGWAFAIPILAWHGDAPGDASASALDAAWTLWSTEVRYLGVGAMLVGAVISLVSVGRSVWMRHGESPARREPASSPLAHVPGEDIPRSVLLSALGLAICIMLGLYQGMLHQWGLTLLTTVIMLAAAFLFAAVSSYVTGLVGSSNNPVSGMTIAALMATGLLLLALGMHGDQALMAILGVAAVVCCAACTAGDCSQDLKTGAILGARPALQQWAQIAGVLGSAFVLAPVLSLLHAAYGIGEGLKAPQATLFASLAQGFFGEGRLPWSMILAGAGLGLLVLVLDRLVFHRGSFRLHVMPLAVGIYLPLTLSVPILLGGLLRLAVERHDRERSLGAENGTLFASGLIAGEALMGVFLAAMVYWGLTHGAPWLPTGIKEAFSLAAFFLLGWAWLRRRG